MPAHICSIANRKALRTARVQTLACSWYLCVHHIFQRSMWIHLHSHGAARFQLIWRPRMKLVAGCVCVCSTPWRLYSSAESRCCKAPIDLKTSHEVGCWLLGVCVCVCVHHTITLVSICTVTKLQGSNWHGRHAVQFVVMCILHLFPVHLSPQVCTYRHKCASISTSVHLSAQVCIYLHKCAPIATSVHPSPQVCIHLHKCASIYPSVHLSPQVCTYLHKCASISTSVHLSPQVCIHLQCIYLHKCACVLLQGRIGLDTPPLPSEQRITIYSRISWALLPPGLNLNQFNQVNLIQGFLQHAPSRSNQIRARGKCCKVIICKHSLEPTPLSYQIQPPTPHTQPSQVPPLT